MTEKILVLDIDGTLTNSEKEISPETKKVITKSSKDIVIAIRKPAKIPGIIAGIVTLNIVCISVAPKS